MTVTDYIKHISKLSDQAVSHMKRSEHHAALQRLFAIEASLKATIPTLYAWVHDRSSLCKTCGRPI